MRTSKVGALEVRLVGGTDGQGGGTGPLVVFFHGYGAPGDDLVALHGALNVTPDTRFAFPAAPIALGGSFELHTFGFGAPRAWWPIDIEELERALATGSAREMRTQVPDGLAEARAMVATTLELLVAELRPSHLVIGGFSQGAMLAMDVALETDRALDAVVLFSGTYLAERLWKPAMPKRAGLPVLLTHGTHDPLLPHALAEALAHDLVEAGVRAELVTFRGQHQIPPVALAKCEALLRAVTQPKGGAVP